MILMLLLVIAGATPQSAAVITGHVVSADAARPIPDVRLVVTRVGADSTTFKERVATTDATGRFMVDGLPAGTYAIAATTVGYIFVRRTVDVTEAGVVDLVIPLAEGTGTYTESVNVSAAGDRPPLEASSQQALGSSALQDLRGVVTDDPLRAVQAMPGVATGDDFRSDFSVRGSAFRQTGVVVDGTATPLLLHTVRGEANTGSIAMINTDVLDRATLFSGPHTRRHGDWLGATLQFDMREGSRDRRGLRAAVSGTAASLVTEGPVGQGRRGAWIVSVRRSYLDWLIRKVEPEFDSALGFYDGYAKLVYDLTPRHQVQVMAVAGKATFEQTDIGRVNGLAVAESRSTLGSVAWRYGGSRAVLTTRVSFTGSDFKNSGVLQQQLARGYSQSVVARTDLAVPLPKGWTFEAGALRERQRQNEIARLFRSAPNNTISVSALRDLSPRTTLLSGWGQVTHASADGGLTIGARVSDRTIADRRVVAPWVLAERRLGRISLRGAIGKAGQFPDPLFVFAGAAAIGPERAWNGDTGLAYQIDTATDVRVTGFYRSETRGLRPAQEDRLDPVTGARQSASTFPTVRASLDTDTRGVEAVLTRRSLTGLSGWIGYMWAHTRATDVVTGETFDSDFDQRHTLNAVLTSRLSYRTTLGAKLRIGSNTPLTGYFAGDLESLRLGSSRNVVRLPVYARLDVRATRTFTFDARRLTLFVEVMNVLGRDNVGQAEGSIRGSLQAEGFLERLIPLVPSAGLLVEF